MRRTLRGPLGWALAAGLVIAACGGTATPPAASGAPQSAGPRVGSFDRPIVLAFMCGARPGPSADDPPAMQRAFKFGGQRWGHQREHLAPTCRNIYELFRRAMSTVSPTWPGC